MQKEINFEERISYHFRKQQKLLEEYNFYSNHLAQPLEVILHEGRNAPFNLWDKMITRPRPTFF
jgi:hypothetical protein